MASRWRQVLLQLQLPDLSACPAKDGAMLALSVFVELRFWLLVVFSVVLPAALYAALMAIRAISRAAVAVPALALALALVLVAGVDVHLLQSLAALAKATLSVVDDGVLLSELSIALYALPLMLGGIGVNLISHVLLRHLEHAEKRFERRHLDD